LPGTFDYLPPARGEIAELRAGARLLVPFGRGTRCGLIVEVATASNLPPERLKRAERILDNPPILDGLDLDLLQWAAAYYRHPVGEVMQQALPIRLRKGAEPLDGTLPGWRATKQGMAIAKGDLKRAPRQAAVLEVLQQMPHGISRQELYARVGRFPDALRGLQAKRWAEPCACEAQSETQSETQFEASRRGPELTVEQRQAVEAVSAALGRFGAFVLDGVTGSGKTEVYLCLVQQVLEAGRQALILVPEISLTPQLMRRFRSRIGPSVALFHSGLSEADRERAWHRVRTGDARVLIGTRSAVFAPVPDLGLIVVDEEHDLSYKQQEGFRYSARDLAVVRAQQRSCPVLLGSATPSLETLYNARTGRYRRLVLSCRTGTAGVPRIDLLDTRSVRLDTGLSPTLLRLVGEELSVGNQVLLFLNRRGYAPVLTCHGCGWVAGCPQCDSRLVVHQDRGALWCHHCGYKRRIFGQCPDCGSGGLSLLGQGTARMEERLAQRFPGVDAVRIDRDSTRRRGALQAMLADAAAGKYSLLLGTQMLAKGHHFPRVTLVGILDVDQGLFSADFRAAERMAQLVVQVAGRAGREDRPGRVLIQTRYPDHPMLQRLVRHGYGRFANAALVERREASLPPFTFQALVRAESREARPGMDFLEWAAGLARGCSSGDVEIWGPVPAPMERRAGRYRAHLLLQSGQRSVLQGMLGRWIPCLYDSSAAGAVRWSLDVDPQEMF
jgi:primosomal protein N' (replication factor Y)